MDYRGRPHIDRKPGAGVPKWFTAGACVAAVLGLSACSSGSGVTVSPSGSVGTSDPGPTVSLPADPRAAVLAAAGHLGDQSFQLKYTSLTSTAVGAIDPRGNTSGISTSLGDGTTINVRQLGNDVYVEVTGASAEKLHAVAGKWMHVDTSALPATSALGPNRNQAAASAALLRTATAVHLVGTRTYQGRVDLSTGSSTLPAGLASKMRSVPFSAVLDPWGRFDSLSYDLDQVVSGAGQLESNYLQYGAPIDIPRPADAETVPMPADFEKSIGA
jgi:hypothetical protein